MKRSSLAILAVAVLAACSDAPTSSTVATTAGPKLAATAFTHNAQVPFTVPAFVPCANGGVGEFVLLEGDLNILVHLTISDAGTVSMETHAQPMGISGTGLVTGDKYQGTGVSLAHVSIGPGGLPFEDTLIENFRVIGQGPDNNLLVHQTLHITVNENGDVTAEVTNISVECR